MRTSILKAAQFTLVAGLAFGTLTTIPGCASPPTQGEVDSLFNREAARLDRLYRELVAMCEDHSDPQGCIDAVIAWHRDARTKLEEMRVLAQQNRWEELKQRRDDWEDELQDLIPDFPGLKDIFEPLLSDIYTNLNVTGTPSNSGGCDNAIAMVNALAPGLESVNLATGETGSIQNVLEASPCYQLINSNIGGTTTEIYAVAASSTTSLTLNGNVTLSGIMVNTGSVSGVLNISLFDSSDGTISGYIIDGSATLTVGTDTITFGAESDLPSEVFLDQSGSGYIDGIFAMSMSDTAWDALTPGYIHVQVPVVRNADGTWSISTGGAVETSSLIPFRPDMVLDYDRNGMYEYNSDLAAFVVGLAAHEWMADVNVDGLWDADDIAEFDRIWASDIGE